MSDLTLTNQALATAFGYPVTPDGALQRLYRNPDTYSIPAYAIRKAFRKGQAAIQNIEADRQDLLESFAQKDEAGEKVPDGNGGVLLKDVAGFSKEYAALMNKSVTLEGVRAVTLKELENIKLSPEDLDHLGPFVVESDG